MSNNELGMFGLGWKAPLSYTSTFYFIARKNGIERKYMMYEGEDVNTIDLLYESETTEGNGVKVIVPVKYSDFYSFKVKIKGFVLKSEVLCQGFIIYNYYFLN
jgi:hypothetical protein